MIKGHFDGPPILLGPQTYEGFPGYHLILPFLRSDGGSTILVNRGFITTTRANAIRAGTQVPPGLTLDKEGKLVATGEEVVLEGLLPKTGEKTVWMHENKPETNEWFWKDVEKMAEVAGGEEKGVQPVFVDVIAGLFLSFSKNGTGNWKLMGVDVGIRARSVANIVDAAGYPCRSTSSCRVEEPTRPVCSHLVRFFFFP